jgi:hypothetical protein
VPTKAANWDIEDEDSEEDEDFEFGVPKKAVPAAVNKEKAYGENKIIEASAEQTED